MLGFKLQVRLESTSQDLQTSTLEPRPNGLRTAVLVLEIPLYQENMQPSNNLGNHKSPNLLPSSSLEGKLSSKYYMCKMCLNYSRKYLPNVLFNQPVCPMLFIITFPLEQPSNLILILNCLDLNIVSLQSEFFLKP